ncbi:hypothetical protein BDZ89DRAFT_1076581 [Hymenopellis radicata]|nr:hypothetical protein BDZ89DRAFT_1076581 [Hymenopellis radicata]
MVVRRSFRTFAQSPPPEAIRSNQPMRAKRIPEPAGWLGDFFRFFGARQAGPLTPVRCMILWTCVH